jgi:hypothetical protein
MTRGIAPLLGAALTAGLLAAGLAAAHVTPPVVLVSDRDAVADLLSGATRFFVREVTLTPQERQAIQQRWNWSPQEDFYRFYVGRDDQGKAVAAALFVTEVTMHGPVRVAVGLEPDGKVRGATVVELSEETYPWVKPLIDRNFTRQYAGRDSQGPFGLSGTDGGPASNQMGQFYGQVIASLIQRGAILYDVAVLKRGG